MADQNKYRVTMTIEGEGETKNDAEIKKIVTASTPEEALTKARQLVKSENPELNYMKIYFWAIEQRYD
jgi:hypothetical protein